MSVRAIEHCIAIVICCAALSACATQQIPPPPNTPSGRPEITIPAERTNAALAYILDVCMNRGYTIRRQTPTMIMLERPANNMWASMLFASQFNANPHLRVIWNIISTETTTRIIGDLSIVTNPGSGYEQPHPITHGAALQQMQEILNTAAQRT